MVDYIHQHDSMSSAIFKDTATCQAFLEAEVLEPRHCSCGGGELRIKTRQEKIQTIIYSCSKCYHRQNIMATTVFAGSDSNVPRFLKKIWCRICRIANQDIDLNLDISGRTWIRFKNKIDQVIANINQQPEVSFKYKNNHQDKVKAFLVILKFIFNAHQDSSN